MTVDIKSFKNDYTLLNSFTVEKNIKVEKYEHKQTKFRIYNVKKGGPLVSTAVFLPTETLSHDGCPHTLEHLVFLGSEDYPYKGYLDIVANQSNAVGTNAFTATNHTGYELVTVGKEGFLQAIPIYLDHIIYPTITDEAFVTEIHHINSKGEDAGVVYCEMQERENKRINLLLFAISQELYTTKSGYASETGGLLADIRTLKVETIREYHRSYYRPDNAGLMVVGDVDIEDIFRALDPIQKKFISKGELKPMVRPFSSTPQLFNADITKKVIFPSEEEKTGDCTLTFAGPKFGEFQEYDAFIILIEYLTSGSSSPIGSTMIDVDDSYGPNCSSCNLNYSTNFHTFWFDSCDLKRIDEIKSKFLSVLRNLVETKTFDLERIRDTILSSKLNTKLQIEIDANDIFSELISSDMIYGTGDSFEKQIDFENVFEILLNKDADYWLGLISKYFLDKPCLEIHGIPSIQESKDLSKRDIDRIAKQAADLGSDKLKELGEIFENAQSINNKPLDKKLFDNIKLPSPDSISLYNLLSVRNDKEVHANGDQLIKEGETRLKEYLVKSNSNKVPFDILFNHVESLFINIRMGFNTNNLDDDLRVYLPLFMDLLTMSSIKKQDGTIIDHNKLDALILKYTIDFEAGIGSSCSSEGGDFSQYGFITANLKKDYYSNVIELFKDILCNIIIEPERIKIVAKKLLDNIPSRKESGEKMVRSLIHHTQFNNQSKSNCSSFNYQKQFKFLTNIIRILGGDDDENEEDGEEEDVEGKEDGDEKEGEDTHEHKCCDHEHEEEEEEEKKPIKITEEVLSLIEQLKKVQNYFVTRNQEIFTSVGGNIFELESPKEPWLEQFAHFGSLSNELVVPPSPSSFQYDLINKEYIQSMMGKSLAVVVSGSGSANVSRFSLNNLCYDDLITKDYVSLFLAINYLDQLEGPFWKRIRSGYAYSYRFSTNPESGILSFGILRCTNPEKALQVCKDIIQETLDNPLDPIWFAGSKSTAVFDIATKEKNYSSLLEQSYYDGIRGWVDHNYRDFFKLFAEVTHDDIKSAMRKYLLDLFDDSKSVKVFSSNREKLVELENHYGSDNFKIINDETYFD